MIGWKIDIKSEEEKRRELETRMADMVISGAPVSILIDHGLPDHIVEALVSAGIGTVERLGSMTPEELEVIPGIDEDIVEPNPNGRWWRSTDNTSRNKANKRRRSGSMVEEGSTKAR